MVRPALLAMVTTLLMTGCGDRASDETTGTQIESEDATRSPAETVNDLLVCMTYASFEVRSGASFGGGTEETTFSAKTVVVGAKGNRQATILVPGAADVPRIAEDPSLLIFFGDPVAGRVFVTADSPLEVTKGGQPTDPPADVRDAVADCLE